MLFRSPKRESRTSPARYEQLMDQHGLPLKPCRPEWLDYSFIESCYDYDFVVWATYGMARSRGLFPRARYQVAEKMLIQLPAALYHLSLVVVDGLFTGFDPYGCSRQSLFGSAKHTNHWSTTDPWEPVPEPYASRLNGNTFEPVPFTRFNQMRADAALAVPAAARGVYLGSRFVMRVIKDNPDQTAGPYMWSTANRMKFTSFPVRCSAP